ncbi:putative E3 ubiquitin-protein ligase TRIM39-like [Apostichopus japonicus]|uniref:Putative E3 ubiquitin-protein ligase TRIM39-like n=1 Tax=Stichopus japonicus TaxID=307972 RepID=A0A2G8JQQ1_STIJA|nr:putative E3 ubiquitin-protein ligase TRIM39-like [Apostichopus japonicus]
MASISRISDMTICAVCCEEIIIHTKLNCGHSFCPKHCVEDLRTMQTFVCPICKRESSRATAGLANDFRTKFRLQSSVQCGAVPKLLSPPSNERRTKEKDSARCSLHDNIVTHFCETCHEALCRGCVKSSHDGSHDIVKHSEALQRGINDLQPILEEVSKLGAQLKDLSKATQAAKRRYEAEANEIKKTIIENETKAHHLVAKKSKDLCNEVDVEKLLTLKKVKEIEMKTADLSLFSDYVNGISESLKADFTKEDLTRKGVISGLVAKKEKLRHSIKALQSETLRDKIGVSFISRKPSEIDFGNVDKVHVNADEKGVADNQVRTIKAIKLEEFADPEWTSDRYIGHVWISVDECIILYKNLNSNRRLRLKSLTDNRIWFLDSVITKESVTLVSPVLGSDGRSILINDSKTVHKITFNIDLNDIKVQEKILQNRLLHTIQAISWDENRRGCYVLLQDGITIKKFDFSTARHSEEPWEVKLRDGIKCSGPMHFHISESGSMAIIDRKSVKFFQKIQSHVTQTIKGPTTQVQWKPFFVTSRKVPQKWVVGWEAYMNGINRNLAIYQYSRELKLEQLVLRYENTYDDINTFSFVDEHHVALDMQGDNKGSFKLFIFYLHQR